jgi:hypothetical protein
MKHILAHNRTISGNFALFSLTRFFLVSLFPIPLLKMEQRTLSQEEFIQGRHMSLYLSLHPNSIPCGGGQPSPRLSTDKGMATHRPVPD